LLLRALLSAAIEEEAQPGVANLYGQRYTIDFDLATRPEL
jgi:hypothetical protein